MVWFSCGNSSFSSLIDRPSRLLRSWPLPASSNIDPIPTRIPCLAVVFGQTLPVWPRQPIKIVNHFSIFEREFASQLLGSTLSGAIHIHEPVVAFLQSEHCNIGQST